MTTAYNGIPARELTGLRWRPTMADGTGVELARLPDGGVERVFVVPQRVAITRLGHGEARRNASIEQTGTLQLVEAR